MMAHAEKPKRYQIKMLFLTLALIFLIRLRFPKDKSIAEILPRRYGYPALQLYRSTERLDYKLRKSQCDLEFLNTCYTHNLTPTFLHFKTYNKQVNSSRLYRNCQRKFLLNEIREKSRLVKTQRNKLNSTLSSLKQCVSFIDYTHLSSLIERTNVKSLTYVKSTQKRKLFKLGFTDPFGLPAHKVIFNFSSRQLNVQEESLLSKGLNFALPTNKSQFLQHFLPFENLFKKLGSHTFYSYTDKTFDFLKSSLKQLAHSSFYSRNPHNTTLTKEEHCALKSLKNDDSIIITRPDKGNGVVLLDKSDYIQKVHDILNDKSKFTRISECVFSKLIHTEDKINNFLRKLKRDQIIDDPTYSHLFVSGSQPGVLYGLPKVHKDGCPVRPILSAIGTPNYKLAKFIIPIVSPLTTNNYTVKDSFSFAKEICELNLNHCTMASFDIKSLFTNIPLNETISICTEQLFTDSDMVHGLNKSDFHKLLSLSVKDSIFMFNDATYKQNDGLAMGNPLSCSFANIFLTYYEAQWLDNCPVSFKPLLYRRYIDDTFLLFSSPDHIPLFLNYLNSKHRNIEFTCETEQNHKLPFLDINIEKTESSFSTSIYRKPTFTGLMTKFNSNIPIQYKRNLILTLVTRAYKICSSYFSLHLELEYLRNTLKLNGFPTQFTDTYIGKQLTKLHSPQPKAQTVQKNVIYFCIPFLGSKSYNIRNKINKLIRDFYPQLSLRIVFQSPMTLSRCFRFKDRIPDALRSSVVYNYKCSRCNATYIGQTKRHLTARIAEHKGVSFRTGFPLSKPSYSAIRNHSEALGHVINKNNFSILFTTTDSVTRVLAESLLTQDLKPSLSAHETSTPLLCF